ncbi:MAG: hypothetical protein ACHQRJ_14970 [Alphaproteobacteria bacterium]
MKKRAKSALFSATLALALAGGAAVSLGLTNPQLPPPGQSPVFDDGYVDGCRTGFQDAGRDGYQTAGHKDDTRYLREVDYKAGYDQGFNACFQEEKAHPKIKSDGGARS